MSKRLAQRYAQALYDAAVDLKQLEAVCSDIKFLKEIYDQSPDFRRFCALPSLQSSVRLRILKDIFKSKTSTITENFILYIAERNRLNLLNLVCQQFDAIFAERHNIQKIEIQSSFELPANLIQSIAQHLKEKLHKEIVPQFSINTSLLGGVRVQVKDDVYDSTIKSKLNKLRQTIMTG